LIISAGLLSFQQLSGINVVLFYSQSIFEKAGSSLEPAIATICVGIVQVFASGCTPLVVDRLGRKLILLVSAGGMAISLGFLGLFFLLDHQKAEIVSSISWLPIVSLVLFVFVYCVGFGPLPWAVFGKFRKFSCLKFIKCFLNFQAKCSHQMSNPSPVQSSHQFAGFLVLLSPNGLRHLKSQLEVMELSGCSAFAVPSLSCSLYSS
jgi:uncharacterized membrane protein